MTTAFASLPDGRLITITPTQDGARFAFAWTAQGPGWCETSTAPTLCAAFEAATAALAYRERTPE